jgi:hypothetical protein
VDEMDEMDETDEMDKMDKMDKILHLLGLDVQRPQLIIHIRLPVPKDEQDLGSML